mmetsp:Transcript_32342/g.52256  ORF Transcript_32342/g.52256 Transcript_32342/m.52256 type:complete len:418 (+) Transcript_32342:120-1373(+)|eukprot:CAMPEP_0184660384 /NCGR_PEP_ID=MMETSP0308-20130426/33690_1 /TAXON_ID=38269 /ORGANISM="Gloeochaete witrockiana, Strain SAG 46.84" /LENGTH=417 /DNA_ID=CAMNT_0027100919 /DNA_START=38 /DNA_END=1291 /DNA_ORIENTATION=+
MPSESENASEKLSGRLLVHLVSALLPEREAVVNPYARLKFYDQKHRTKTYENGGQPVWDQIIEFQVSSKDGPRYIVDVEIIDAINREILGFVGIGFERMAKERRSVDMWFPLRELKVNRMSGKVHFILNFHWGEVKTAAVVPIEDANESVRVNPQWKSNPITPTAAWADMQESPSMVPRTTAALLSAGVYLKKASKNAKGVVQVGPGTEDELADTLSDQLDLTASALEGPPMSPMNQSSAGKRPKSTPTGEFLYMSSPSTPSSISSSSFSPSASPQSPVVFMSEGLQAPASPVPASPLERTSSGHGPLVSSGSRRPSRDANSSSPIVLSYRSPTPRAQTPMMSPISPSTPSRPPTSMLPVSPFMVPTLDNPPMPRRPMSARPASASGERRPMASPITAMWGKKKADEYPDTSISVLE